MPDLDGLVKIIETGLVAGGSLVAGVKATQQAFSAIDDARRSIGSLRSGRSDAKDAREVLGLRRIGGTTYRHDSLHPLYSGVGMHPDNLRALVATSGSDVLLAKRDGMLQVEDRVTGGLEDNLVLIGSPTSEGVSRVLFGYEARAGHPDELILGHSPLDLPYRMVLDKREVAAEARRYVAGRGQVSRPNWRFVTDGRVFIPATRDGWLEQDFLLVTRVRNYLSSEALDGNRFVVSFSGAHGTGTRAVEVLMRDRRALRGLGECLDGDLDRSFQALFAVKGLIHDRVKGTYATSVALAEPPRFLPDRESIWRTARDDVAPRMQAWLKGADAPEC